MHANRPSRTDLFEELNDRIVMRARESPETSTEVPWTLFCECDDPDCLVPIDLSLREYARLRKEGRPLLAPGHELSATSRASVERRGSRADAALLRRRASHG